MEMFSLAGCPYAATLESGGRQKWRGTPGAARPDVGFMIAEFWMSFS